MTESDIIEKLKALGFNTYEAKVYVALLGQHPATGYEISKESGVPQARAYDTLKALEKENVVVADKNGRPITYTPIPPEELLDRWERSHTTAITYLRDALPSVARETVEPVTILRGEQAILSYVQEMIRHAKRSIFLEVWTQEAEVLQPALKEAQDRGVTLRVVGYGNCFLDGIEVWNHAWTESIESSLGGRWLGLAVDDREGIVGRTSVEDGHRQQAQALVTRNLGIVILIKELVVHDIFLMDVEQNLPEEMERIYGKNMAKLRLKVLGEANSILAPKPQIK